MLLNEGKKLNVRVNGREQILPFANVLGAVAGRNVLGSFSVRWI